ncbi:hypothetical protein PS6_006941 [Mucor atramentarius]
MYYPEWDLLNLSIVFVAIVGSIALIAREFSPSTRLSYSKFNATSSEKSSEIYVGYLAFPSLSASTLFLVWSFDDYRMLMISATIFVHYLKRVLLFIAILDNPN